MGCLERVRPVAAAASDLIYGGVRERQQGDALARFLLRPAQVPGDDRAGLAGTGAGLSEEMAIRVVDEPLLLVTELAACTWLSRFVE